MRKPKQFETDRKPGDQLGRPVAQVGDGIVGIIFQPAGPVDALIECLRIGLEDRGSFPAVFAINLDTTLHSLL